MPNGKLIVLEGIDGCGKSTQTKLLREYLSKEGKKVEVSYEPTGGLWGTKIRKAAESGHRLSPEEETECFILDRLMHAERKIRPALRKGIWVILDRYYPSTMAYQGASGGDTEILRQRNEDIAPIPDCALWLDIPVSVASERIAARGRGADAFEKKVYLEKVRDTYASFTMKWWHRIDATGSVEEVQARIREEMRLIFS